MKTLYTDGSAVPNPGPGGWAWYCVETQQSDSGWSNHETTNNEMELTAILEAFAQCDDHESVLLYSDSKLAMDFLTGHAKPKLTHLKGLVHAIKILRDAKDLRVTFIRVAGHKGDPYNEKVDRLANKAAHTSKRMMVAEAGVPTVPMSEQQTTVGLVLSLEWADLVHVQALLRACNEWGIIARGNAAVNVGGKVTSYEIQDNQIQ